MLDMIDSLFQLTLLVLRGGGVCWRLVRLCLSLPDTRSSKAEECFVHITDIHGQNAVHTHACMPPVDDISGRASVQPCMGRQKAVSDRWGAQRHPYIQGAISSVFYCLSWCCFTWTFTLTWLNQIKLEF